MSQKIVSLPDIGPVVLAKRRDAKNLRLSILPDGRVRVSMPTWVPYSAGITFVNTRRAWIINHLEGLNRSELRDGQRIGKSYRLSFRTGRKPKTQARLGINSITITTNLDSAHESVQAKAKAAAERALKKEAQSLLSVRLATVSKQNNLPYRSLKIKRLSSRWGSCSSRGDITLNLFLIQLPWPLIDYVLVHELAHTVHHDHSRQFWQLVEKIMPDYKLRRKTIKAFRPVILAQ